MTSPLAFVYGHGVRGDVYSSYQMSYTGKVTWHYLLCYEVSLRISKGYYTLVLS